MFRSFSSEGSTNGARSAAAGEGARPRLLFQRENQLNLILEHPLSEDYVEDNDINQNDIEKEGDDAEEQKAQQEASERNVEHLPKRRHEQQNDR